MNKKLLESTKLALEMEKKGYDLYTKHARETDQPVMSSIFLGIAERELKHIERIETLYNEASKENINYKLIEDLTLPIDRKELLSGILAKLQEHLKEKPSHKISDSYKPALALEKDSYEYYKKLAAEADDSIVKKFFEVLSKEENEHYSILLESQHYLDKPDEWFHKQERWIVEGG